jgi:hypothetical protein
MTAQQLKSVFWEKDVGGNSPTAFLSGRMLAQVKAYIRQEATK